MLALAAQPAEKRALEQLRVDAVRLRAPMFTRHRNAARMDHLGLDLSRAQPTRQPKAISAGLEGNDDPDDGLAGLYRLVAPTIQKLQKRVSIGIMLLQGFARDARDQAGNEPALETHFDHSDKRAILIEGDEGPAEIILLHGGTFRLVENDDGATPSSPAP